MSDLDRSARAQRFTKALEGFFSNDIDGFMSIYADDAVHTFPFAPHGLPDRVVGKAAIDAWMRQVDGIVTFDGSVEDLRILEGADSVTAEWSASGRFSSGQQVRLSYVAVVRYDGDAVIEYHDYMNPLQLQPGLVNVSPKTSA